MTFTAFEKVVKDRYPEMEVYPHGSGRNRTISVRVQFRPGGKCYDYNGTYVEVLNRLGILSVYRAHYDLTKKILADYISRDGEICFFTDEPADYSKQIAEYRDLINRYDTQYLIVD